MRALAGRLGTEVEPTCWVERAVLPRAPSIFCLKAVKVEGQEGSGSRIVMGSLVLRWEMRSQYFSSEGMGLRRAEIEGAIVGIHYVESNAECVLLPSMAMRQLRDSRCTKW